MTARRDWQKTDPHLRTHPAFIYLCGLLRARPVLTHGLLVGLWSMAFVHAEDGDLTRFQPARIAASIGWEDDPGVLLDALLEAGFLDRVGDRLLIHDWADWGGAVFRERTQTARRVAEHRERHPETDVTVTNDDVTVGVALQSVTERYPSTKTRNPSLSVPQKKAPTSPSSSETDISPQDFDQWWIAYGRHGSKADARKLYLWWRKDGASAEELLRAAKAYTAHVAATESIPCHGRTFLARDPNRWREWADGEEHGNPRGNGNGRGESEWVHPMAAFSLKALGRDPFEEEP